MTNHLQGGSIQVGSRDAQFLGTSAKTLDNFALQPPDGLQGNNTADHVLKGWKAILLRLEVQQRRQHRAAACTPYEISPFPKTVDRAEAVMQRHERAVSSIGAQSAGVLTLVQVMPSRRYCALSGFGHNNYTDGVCSGPQQILTNKLQGSQNKPQGDGPVHEYLKPHNANPDSVQCASPQLLHCNLTVQSTRETKQ